MTDAAHMCVLYLQHVPTQYLSNALSLWILFYNLQSPQPFTSNPRNSSLIWSICSSPSVAMSVLACSVHLCTSHHPTCPTITSVSQNRSSDFMSVGTLSANFPPYSCRLARTYSNWKCLHLCDVVVSHPSATAAGTSALERAAFPSIKRLELGHEI